MFVRGSDLVPQPSISRQILSSLSLCLQKNAIALAFWSHTINVRGSGSETSCCYGICSDRGLLYWVVVCHGRMKKWQVQLEVLCKND